MPVPVRAIVVGLARFVFTVMLPETAPAVVGAKTALNVMVLFGVSVCAVNPVTLKPVPVTLSEETVRLPVPMFFRVIACVEPVPSATLPKLTLDGVTEIPGCVPVPVSGIAVGDPARFVFTEMLPDTLPAEVGAKTALKVMVLLGVRVCAVKPVTLKPAPEALSDETVRLAVPVFFNVIVWELFEPSATLPKAMLDGVTERPA